MFVESKHNLLFFFFVFFSACFSSIVTRKTRQWQRQCDRKNSLHTHTHTHLLCQLVNRKCFWAADKINRITAVCEKRKGGSCCCIFNFLCCCWMFASLLWNVSRQLCCVPARYIHHLVTTPPPARNIDWPEKYFWQPWLLSHVCARRSHPTSRNLCKICVRWKKKTTTTTKNKLKLIGVLIATAENVFFSLLLFARGRPKTNYVSLLLEFSAQTPRQFTQSGGPFLCYLKVSMRLKSWEEEKFFFSLHIRLSTT